MKAQQRCRNVCQVRAPLARPAQGSEAACAHSKKCASEPLTGAENGRTGLEFCTATPVTQRVLRRSERASTPVFQVIEIPTICETGQSLIGDPGSPSLQAFWQHFNGSSTHLSTGHVDNREECFDGRHLARIAQANLKNWPQVNPREGPSSGVLGSVRNPTQEKALMTVGWGPSSRALHGR